MYFFGIEVGFMEFYVVGRVQDLVLSVAGIIGIEEEVSGS